MIRVLLVVVLTTNAFFLAASQKRRSDLDKFCPLESLNNFRCLSRSNAYKCGVFFLDLPGRGPISWIGGLPDILRKPAVKNSPTIRQSLNNVRPRDFALAPQKCQEGKTANSRCFAIMSKLRQTPFDSCSKNIVNERGTQTFGNILCDRINRFYQGNPPQDAITNIKLGFFHSECGSDWEPTNNLGDNLNAPDLLCCQRGQEGKLVYRPCNGGQDFKTTCPS